MTEERRGKCGNGMTWDKNEMTYRFCVVERGKNGNANARLQVLCSLLVARCSLLVARCSLLVATRVLVSDLVRACWRRQP